jgi:hypothetical protein
VERIGGLPAHPLGECLMMWQQCWVISARCQTLGLCFCSEIK